MSNKVVIAEKKCYHISVDFSKNRIYLVIKEKWLNIEDLEDFQLYWEQVVEQVVPNFTIHADLRLMNILSKEIEELFLSMRLYSVGKGLLHTAEIAAVDDIANLQVEKIANHSKFPFTRFKTPELAEEFLDQLTSITSK